MPSPVRRLPIRLTADDYERLRYIADRRDVHADDLAGDIIATWLAGPGRQELVTALLHPHAPTRRRRSELTGQLQLVEN
jgi:hypothetical protein